MGYRVSTLLSSFGLTPNTSWFTARSRERGHAIHEAAESLLQGLPAWNNDPEIAGHCAALAKFARETRYEVLACERRLHSPARGVHGRPDLVCCISAGQRLGPAIVDVKSGDPYPSHGVQLALYELLVEEAGLRAFLPEPYRNWPWRLLGLYTRENGTCQIKTYDDPGHRIAAGDVLSLAMWRRQYGLMPPDDPDQPDDDPKEQQHGPGPNAADDPTAVGLHSE